MTPPNSAADAVRTRDGRPIEFTRDDTLRRYLAWVDGAEAAFAEYLLTDDLVIFNHTVTQARFEGQGVASQLVKWALEDVRDSARRMLPVCPFVQGYVERHAAEYSDLIYHAEPTEARPIMAHESAGRQWAAQDSAP